jgi:hypothetical protein
MDFNCSEDKWVYCRFVFYVPLYNNIIYAHDDFLDLKKIIEYDQKHNISQLSTSLYKDWDQSYSQRMKNSTPNKNAIDRNCTTNGDKHEDEINLSKKKA